MNDFEQEVITVYSTKKKVICTRQYTQHPSAASAGHMHSYA